MSLIAVSGIGLTSFGVVLFLRKRFQTDAYGRTKPVVPNGCAWVMIPVYGLMSEVGGT